MAREVREMQFAAHENAANTIASRRIDWLLMHAKRANERSGEKGARRLALKAVEELLVAGRFEDAGTTAWKYRLDKDGAADEAISRAAQRAGANFRRPYHDFPGLCGQGLFRTFAEEKIYGTEISELLRLTLAFERCCL